MDRKHQTSDVDQADVTTLELELEVRKAALEATRADLQKRFLAFADEQECVAILEKALAKAHRLL